MHKKIEYLRGQKLHPDSRLTFIKDIEPHINPGGSKERMALFSCECGAEKPIIIFNVKSLRTSSCGCYKKDLLSKSKSTHGMSKSRLYRTLRSMINRTSNPSHEQYRHYGGRGIKVCQQWIEDSTVFFKWAVENSYSDNKEIDRINNNGPYSPDNCRWVSHNENSRNKRNSKYWFIDGHRYETSEDAAKDFLVGSSTISRWCDGYTVKGKYYPPKENCYSELKYMKDSNNG